MTRRPARDMTERTGLIFLGPRKKLCPKLLMIKNNVGHLHGGSAKKF